MKNQRGLEFFYQRFLSVFRVQKPHVFYPVKYPSTLGETTQNDRVK